MSLADSLGIPLRHRFPRVSGDEPASVCELVTTARFSPRERG